MNTVSPGPRQLFALEPEFALARDDHKDLIFPLVHVPRGAAADGREAVDDRHLATGGLGTQDGAVLDAVPIDGIAGIVFVVHRFSPWNSKNESALVDS